MIEDEGPVYGMGSEVEQYYGEDTGQGTGRKSQGEQENGERTMGNRTRNGS